MAHGVVIAKENFPSFFDHILLIPLGSSVLARVFCCQAQSSRMSVSWSMLAYLRNDSLFSYPSCSILLGLAASHKQPAGCWGGSVSCHWKMEEEWSQLELGIYQREFSTWGWNLWKNGFYCNLFVPWSVLSLTGYFSHLKLERCCQAWGHLPLLLTHSHWRPSE